MLLNLVIRNPIVIQFSRSPQHSCHRFLFFLGSSFFFFAFYLVVHPPCNAETDSCLQPYNPFHFYRIGTQVDANIHKAFACMYLSNFICTVVEEWIHGYLCLGCFSSSTHFDLVTSRARMVWRHWVLVFAHDRYSHARNCIGLLSNTGLFSFHW